MEAKNQAPAGRKKSTAKRVLPIIIIVTLLLVIAGGAYYVKTELSSKTTYMGLRNIGELATQSAFFTNVQSIEKARELFGVEVPGTKSSKVFSYDGIIKAGIDFSKIEISVDDKEKRIQIALPEVKILSVTIDSDSLKIYSETDNIFTPIGIQSMSDSQGLMKEEAQKTAIENGLLENARANAENVIRGFLSGLYDLDVYQLYFTDLEPNSGEESA